MALFKDLIKQLVQKTQDSRRQASRLADRRLLEKSLDGEQRQNERRPNLQDIKHGLDNVLPHGEWPDPIHHSIPNISDQAKQDIILSQIDVYAFVGPSGTGKSTRAIELAAKYQIEYIIDDGLLIHGSRIVAGTTAKRAATQLQAVRVAIFLEEGQAQTMRRALADRKPERLLVLGTSDAMINRICEHLHLTDPVKIIRIDDVATADEQRAAKERRMRAGHHTIPVPGMEIKHEFSGNLMGSLGRIFRRQPRDDQMFRDLNDRTVVRPSFSTLGRYSISEEAMEHLIQYIVDDVPGVDGVSEIRVSAHPSGVLIDLDLILEYGFNAHETLKQVQEDVAYEVERQSAMNVLAVNVKACRLSDRRLERQSV